jgi:hypothetical protein
MPFYPFKMLQARERVPNFLLFRYFHLRLTFESIKDLGSTSLSGINLSERYWII